MVMIMVVIKFIFIPLKKRWTILAATRLMPFSATLWHRALDFETQARSTGQFSRAATLAECRRVGLVCPSAIPSE
eukprot:m.96350 g.96350  ORF g.96350 m.96350 type:complete len:75 (-) comp21979_c0_seq7:53-277(-)